MNEKKEFKKFRRKIAFKVVWCTVGILAICIVLFLFVIDGILNDYLADYVAAISRPFYELLVYNKLEVLIISGFAFFLLAVYLASRSVTNYMVKITEAVDRVNKKPEEEVKLPSDLILIENRLNKMRVDLITKDKQAKEAERKKNELIVYMAHDLKTPLTSVIGYLTLLSDERQISKELQDRYLKIALDKANRLEDLTNEFFDITRFNLQTMQVTKKELNLSYLLDQLVDECYPMLTERNLTCQMEKPSQLMYQGDGEKIARAFDNLLKNAINYSYEGTTIKIKLQEIDGYISLRFENKGDQIPAYKLEKLFEKFYRMDESRTSKTGGAGLGLAITKQIVELHGGTIEAKSEGEDISFIIKLPK